MHSQKSSSNTSNTSNNRNVSEGTKKLVAGKQNYKCANSPNSKVVENYSCPLWEHKTRKGSFGEEGYHIDHIKEFCISKNDDITNLQALCVSCHSVKTKRFVIPYMSNLAKMKNKQVKKEEKKESKEKEVTEVKNNDQVYEIEEIIDKKKNGKSYLYLIKWKGYKYSESTWEPRENIFDDKMIQKFEKLYKFYNKTR